jgi:adenylylsulfate kinase
MLPWWERGSLPAGRARATWLSNEVKYNKNMSWVIWITGLPGSGKSTIALKVKEQMPEAVILQSDELRKIVTPHPGYTGDEREYVYKALVYTAKTICELGHNVIIDATAHRRSWRNLARNEFAEVFLKCPLELCVGRERMREDTHAAPGKIYEKGEKGAPVPGFTVPYEEPEDPELTIDTEKESPDEAAEKIIKLIKK